MTPARLELVGRARLLGDDVNTDYLISSARKRESLDPHVLKRHLLEEVDPELAASIRPGDILVAGRNFGCGSAMEVAVTVVLAAGIPAVVARSFARSYYRNAVNNGLVPVECDPSGIEEGDELRISRSGRHLVLTDVTRDWKRPGQALPPVMWAILEAGGLVPCFREHGGFPV